MILKLKKVIFTIQEAHFYGDDKLFDKEVICKKEDVKEVIDRESEICEGRNVDYDVSFTVMNTEVSDIEFYNIFD